MTAIAISGVLHGGLLLLLHQQRFELRAPVEPDQPPPLILLPYRPPPPPPPPAEPQVSPEPPTARVITPRAPQPTPDAPAPPLVLPFTPSPPGPAVDGPPTLGPVGEAPPQAAPVAEPAPSPPPAPAAPPVITRPNWLQRPTAEQMARHYPPRALEREQEGTAVLACRVTATGAVEACTVAGQTPRSAGFGEAALKLAPYFRMSPQLRNGEPVEGGSVRIPIKFALD